MLHVAGSSLLDYDYRSRREILGYLVRLGDGALVAAYQVPGADLDDVIGCCEELEMEGVLVKRQDAPYRPGRRSTDWRKVKCEAWRSHIERRIRR